MLSRTNWRYMFSNIAAKDSRPRLNNAFATYILNWEGLILSTKNRIYIKNTFCSDEIHSSKLGASVVFLTHYWVFFPTYFPKLFHQFTHIKCIKSQIKYWINSLLTFILRPTLLAIVFLNLIPFCPFSGFVGATRLANKHLWYNCFDGEFAHGRLSHILM